MSGKDIGEAMSWGFGGQAVKKATQAPKFKPPAPLEQIDSVSQVSESATDVKKKKRTPAGRDSALLAGLSNALKTRLGQ